MSRRSRRRPSHGRVVHQGAVLNGDRSLHVEDHAAHPRAPTSRHDAAAAAGRGPSGTAAKTAGHAVAEPDLAAGAATPKAGAATALAAATAEAGAAANGKRRRRPRHHR